jgi:hypothetical protein
VTAMATRKAKELAPAGAYSYSETNLDAKMWNLVNIWHGAGSRDTVYCERLFHTIARMIKKGRDWML